MNIFDWILSPEHHFWAILFVFVICADIFAIIHILRNKTEEPASAILWLFLIVDFHLFGLAAYLLVGINRVRTLGKDVRRANEIIEGIRKRGTGPFSAFFRELRKHLIHFDHKEQIPSHMALIDRLLPQTLALGGNRVDLLEDGTLAYPKMLEAIEKAKHHIHLQSYIIVPDETGKKIFAALKKKAEEGVRVRVLFDQIGSGPHAIRFFRHYVKDVPTFEVRAFIHINLFAPYRVQMRNHRKLLVVDGHTCFVGGINISADNDKTIRKNRYIHDLHAKIIGPSVGEFAYSFIKDWCYSTDSDPDTLLQDQSYFPLPLTNGKAIVRAIASGPGQDYEASSKVYLAATHIATKSLWIITPYFVPDKSFITSLCMASAKGVDVRVIIPQNNNHWYVRFATSSLYRNLLENGIQIYEKKGAFSHAKAMLVDDVWATMGSSNCDNRSFRLNYELDFVVEDADFITSLKNQFLREMRHSVEIKIPKKKSVARELIENICSLFAPVM